VAKQAVKRDDTPALQVVMVPVLDIKRNPANYRHHPREQVAQLQHSIREFGQYKNAVLSSDGFLLAGHGEGREAVACVYMPFAADSPEARKLLVADNETVRGSEDDGTQLAALLADIQRTSETGLAGTGYDDSGLD
jgi:hypothetical protein